MTLSDLGLEPKKSFWSFLGEGIRSFALNMLPFGSLIDSGIGLISSATNNAYTRNLQQQLFARDDTSLDRTMAMYERNGINPLLAVPGSQAGNTKGFEPGVLGSNFAQAEQLALQNKLQNANIEYMGAQKKNLDKQLELLGKDAQNKDIERSLNAARLEWAKQYGETRGSGKPVLPPYHESELEQIISAIFNNKEKIKNWFPWMNDNDSSVDEPEVSHSSGTIPKTEEQKNKEYTEKEQYYGLLKTLEKHTVKDSGFPIYDKDNRKIFINWRENKKSGVIEVLLKPGDEWKAFKNDSEFYSWLYDNGYHVNY